MEERFLEKGSNVDISAAINQGAVYKILPKGRIGKTIWRKTLVRNSAKYGRNHDLFNTKITTFPITDCISRIRDIT